MTLWKRQNYTFGKDTCWGLGIEKELNMKETKFLGYSEISLYDTIILTITLTNSINFTKKLFSLNICKFL